MTGGIARHHQFADRGHQRHAPGTINRFVQELEDVDPGPGCRHAAEGDVVQKQLGVRIRPQQMVAEIVLQVVGEFAMVGDVAVEGRS